MCCIKLVTQWLNENHHDFSDVWTSSVYSSSLIWSCSRFTVLLHSAPVDLVCRSIRNLLFSENVLMNNCATSPTRKRQRDGFRDKLVNTAEHFTAPDPDVFLTKIEPNGEWISVLHSQNNKKKWMLLCPGLFCKWASVELYKVVVWQCCVYTVACSTALHGQKTQPYFKKSTK